MRRIVPLLVALAWVGACNRGESASQDAQSRLQADSDSVLMAETAFDSTVFDTLTWKTTQEAHDRGGLVFRSSCKLCHGDAGRGNGNFVLHGDTLRPPSFLAADWRYADDPVGLRRKIFSGNTKGMPHWGLVGLGYRDVDAVSRYITEVLRVKYKE